MRPERQARAVLVAGLLSLACASSGPPAPGAAPERPVSRHADVYLVPIGTTLPGIVDHLIGFYREKLGLEVVAARAAPFDASLYDPLRKQLIAEQLVYLLEVWCEGLSSNPSAIFVGITANDIYARGRHTPYVYAYQDGGRYAVVSSARLTDGPRRASPEPARSRLRKIVTQAIGMLYYDLPLKDDPHSVLSARVATVEAIDAIDESTLERDILAADAARFR